MQSDRRISLELSFKDAQIRLLHTLVSIGLDVRLTQSGIPFVPLYHPGERSGLIESGCPAGFPIIDNYPLKLPSFEAAFSEAFTFTLLML
jgi:hypothetical protein